MTWKIPRETITAAHETGHALVSHHFGSRIRYISNIENADFAKRPEVLANQAGIGPFEKSLIFAAGVSGVMYWRGRSVAGRLGLNKYGYKILSNRLGYYLSKKGSSEDRRQYDDEHLAQGALAQSFYASAVMSLEIVVGMEPLFVRAMEKLVKHTFISRSNFERLVAGRDFDEQENRFEKVKQIDTLWFNTKHVP